MSDTCVQQKQTQQSQIQQRHHHEEACAEKCNLALLPFEGTVADVRHQPLESLAKKEEVASAAGGPPAGVKPHPTACRLVPAPKGGNGGHQLTVRGVVNPRAERFELNLLTGTIHPHAITHAMVDTQIPLHAVFHFGGDVHQVVLNSYLAGDWGRREETEHHPFQRGALFEICVKHFEDRYELRANGKHLAGYTYRLCPKVVNYVQVCGDVELDEVSWSGGGGSEGAGEEEDPAQKAFTTVHAGTCPFCRPPAEETEEEP